MEKFENFDGWVVKNKWGSFVPWTLSRTKSGVIGKINWKSWKRLGNKIVKVKVKLVEIE